MKLPCKLPAVLLACALLTGCAAGAEGTASSPAPPLAANPSSSAPQRLTGVICAQSEDNFTLEDGMGRRYSFQKGAEGLSAPSGYYIGAEVSVAYNGVLGEDGDISKAEVLSIAVAPRPAVFAQFEEQAKAIASTLSADEKLRQMILSAVNTADPAAQVGKEQPAGYVLFRKDFADLTAEAVQEKLAAMQEAAKLPLIMAVDEEGGPVVRISSNPNLRAEIFPAPSELCAAGEGAVHADAAEKASLLLDLGCNVLLAPVADLSLDEGDYIHSRTTGLPAPETAAYVVEVVKAAQPLGCGTVMKHFPGYGNNLNTHTNVSMDERPYQNFVEADFVPFQAGIDAGGQGVLVSHNIVISMDADLPASLSPEVHRILREELGFTGAILTDDLGMDAIGLYTGNEAPAVLAAAAGNDLLLSQNFDQTIVQLKEAYDAGRITDEMVDSAVVRVLSWKLALGLIPAEP